MYDESVDRRELTGPFDVVGDVHGCRSELETLLGELGWTVERDDRGRAAGAVHPEGRTAVLVGDLVDRGPDTPGALRLVMGMVAAGTALCVMGNHEAKLLRALQGRDVRTSHGLQASLDQLAGEDDGFVEQVVEFIEGLPLHLVLDGGRLVVAHAGLREDLQGSTSNRARSFALFGDTTGQRDEYGLPIRLDWSQSYGGEAAVVYGHTPVLDAVWVNDTLCLDTAAVFGNRLTALRWPSREVVSVPAEQVWCEPTRPLARRVASAADQSSEPSA